MTSVSPCQPGHPVPARDPHCLLSPCGGSELCLQQGTWLQEGGCHAWGCSALAAPCHEEGTGSAENLGCAKWGSPEIRAAGGLWPLTKCLAGKRKRGFPPHCFHHGLYQVRRCERSWHSCDLCPSIHPSIHSSIRSPTCPPFVPSFLLKFSLSLSFSLSLYLSLSFCLSVSVSLSLFPVGAGVSVLAQTMEEDTLDDFASDHGASLSMESFTQKSLVSSPEVVTIPFIPHPSLSP